MKDTNSGAKKKTLPFLTTCYGKRCVNLLLAYFLVLTPILTSASAAAAAVPANADIQQIEAETPKQIIKRADRLVRRGEIAEAEKILRRLIELHPKESLAKLKLAYILHKQRRLVEAYDLSFEVAKAEPKNSYAFAVLGVTLLEAGNFRIAETSLVNALNLNRREALAWMGLGMLDFYENRIQRSLEALRTANYIDTNEPDYIFALAQVAARSENYKEAAYNYRRFLQYSPQNDEDRRARIKGLIDFLEYLGGKMTLYEIGGAPQTSVRIKLVQDRPIVELRVNKNDEVLQFVLDTGSGISVMSEAAAQRLDIDPVARGGKARGFGGDGKFDIVYGFLNKISIGDVSIKNVPIYIRKFHSSNEEIDGYIGLSLISKFLTTLDYGEQLFMLQRKDQVRDDLPGERDALALPLRLTSAGFLSGEVQIEGVENRLNFIVDTGASLSVISDELAGMEEISRYIINEKIRVIGSAGETGDMPLFMLPRITFGNNSRDRVKAIALDLDVINETSGFEQAGILGGNFLKNYRLTFDFQNSKVLFVPVKQ